MKVLSLLFHLMLEGGMIDPPLREPGRFIIRCLYPPHWFKKTTYAVWPERIVGFCFWFGLAYLMYDVLQL